MEDLENNNQTFESIKHIDENGVEFWYARELMNVLQYAKWKNLKKVIEKAIIMCENSGISIKDCFPDVRKPIISGKGNYSLNQAAKMQELKTHYDIGKNIREVIAKKGGTMIEDLPTPEKSLKKLEKENKKGIKILDKNNI